jgi:hypothetical protein
LDSNHFDRPRFQSGKLFRFLSAARWHWPGARRIVNERNDGFTAPLPFYRKTKRDFPVREDFLILPKEGMEMPSSKVERENL